MARPKRPRDDAAPAPSQPVAEEFALGEGETIELGHLLKVVGVCESGGEAKHRIQDGEVRVNGEVETRRGRNLRAGDVVVTRGRTIRCRAGS